MRARWAVIAVMLAVALLVFLSGTRRPSVGFMIDVAAARADCGDGSLVYASAVGHHRVTLNTEPSIDIRGFPARLHEKTKARGESLVFVRADPGVSFGEFVQLVDAVHPEADIISLITPQVDALVRFDPSGPIPPGLRCLAPSCRSWADLAKFGRRSVRKVWRSPCGRVCSRWL